MQGASSSIGYARDRAQFCSRSRITRKDICGVYRMTAAMQPHDVQTSTGANGHPVDQQPEYARDRDQSAGTDVLILISWHKKVVKTTSLVLVLRICGNLKS